MKLNILMVSAWGGGTPRRLSRALGIRLMPLKVFDSVRVRNADLIVNWGTSRVFDYTTAKVMNYPSGVARACNKLSCFKALFAAKIPTLEFTTSRLVAEGWGKESSIVGHFDVHGHSGSGLELFKKKKDGVATITRDDCEVYTKYFPKETESRVHLIRSKELYNSMYLEKVRILEDGWAERGITATPDTYIRTWDNGWNFARSRDTDAHAVALAAQALAVFKLDYGAVDIMKDKKGKYVVGEINTAPGLEGMALAFYERNLGNLINSAEYR